MTQRVAIYAKKVFQEALNNISKSTSRSPTRKVATAASAQVHVNLSENMGEGPEASIFELLDVMSKDAPINELTLKLLDNLKPEDFNLFDDAHLEHEHLKFAQMKITAKIARSFNFEHRSFVEHLDIRKNGQI